MKYLRTIYRPIFLLFVLLNNGFISVRVENLMTHFPEIF